VVFALAHGHVSASPLSFSFSISTASREQHTSYSRLDVVSPRSAAIAFGHLYALGLDQVIDVADRLHGRVHRLLGDQPLAVAIPQRAARHATLLPRPRSHAGSTERDRLDPRHGR